MILVNKINPRDEVLGRKRFIMRNKLILTGICTLLIVSLTALCMPHDDIFYDRIPDNCTVSAVIVDVESGDTAWSIAERVKQENKSTMSQVSTKTLVDVMEEANGYSMDHLCYGGSVVVPIYVEK